MGVSKQCWKLNKPAIDGIQRRSLPTLINPMNQIEELMQEKLLVCKQSKGPYEASKSHIIDIKNKQVKPL